MGVFSRIAKALGSGRGAIPEATGEIGSSGLRAYGGRVVGDEFLPQLQGANAIRTFTEMRDNDPVVGGAMFAIEMLLRNTKLHAVAPNGQRGGAYDEAVQFAESLLDDMSTSWADTVAEILTMLTYGWAAFELVLKKREGLNGKDPSKNADGLFGIKKMAPRSQDTLLRWEFDEQGEVTSMVQMAPKFIPNVAGSVSGNAVITQQVTIPAEKLILFRTTARKNSPEGRSVLRNAYRPWFLKKRLEDGEAIGIYRNLAGLPVARIPAQFMDPNASPEEQAVYASFQKLVRDTVMDEQAGIILPSTRDKDTKELLFDFELLASPATNKVEARSAINDYDKRIAMTVLADFIMLGTTSAGSFALSVNKTDVFTTALTAWSYMIAETLNRRFLPVVWAANGLDPALMPEYQPSPVAQMDMAAIAALITAMASAGAPLFPNIELENFLLSAAGLPTQDPAVRDQLADMIRAAQEQAQKDQIAQDATGGQPPQDEPVEKRAPSEPHVVKLQIEQVTPARDVQIVRDEAGNVVGATVKEST